jgi:chemotaxis protein MotB
MAARAGKASVLIRKVREDGHHGHHGGAWKVAYADFVTAMMAFFLMLWLLSTSSEDTLKGIAEYFTDASDNEGVPGGVAGVLNGIVMTPPRPMFDRQSSTPVFADPSMPTAETTEDAPAVAMAEDRALEDATDLSAAALAEAQTADRFETAKTAIFQALARSEDLGAFADSILVERTPEGLRIQLLDRENVAMFPSGSDRMHPHTERLLRIVTQAVAALPNRLSIRGHTDARPFVSANYDNWRLSSARADATRRVMLAAGLAPERVAEVVGRADAEPLFAADPNDPRNRRISIVLLATGPSAPAAE